MSRILIATLSLLVSTPAFAVEALDSQGHVFGLVNDGTYRGGGTLESQSFWIPDAKYVSERNIKGGVIEARTTATVLGIEVATASARLQVVSTDGQNFDMLDLDSPGSDGKPVKAGSGSCELLSCSFEATVMSGRLTLRETWVPGEKSFELIHGSQVYDGKPANYEGHFSLSN